MNISSIYRKINENECINNIYSQFWIYDLEEKIQSENGITSKLITVKIFDRNYKSKNQLQGQAEQTGGGSRLDKGRRNARCDYSKTGI